MEDQCIPYDLSPDDDTEELPPRVYKPLPEHEDPFPDLDVIYQIPEVK